jgi:hypothetical protein
MNQKPKQDGESSTKTISRLFVFLTLLALIFGAADIAPFIRLSAESQRLIVHSAQSLPAVDLADLTQALEKIFNLIS